MPDSIFREIADSVPVMIWRAGVEGERNWFNERWLDFVGQPLARQLGGGWEQLVHKDDREMCDAFVAAFAMREKVSLNYRLRRADGAWRWMLDSAAPFYRDGLFAGYYGSCMDVTDQREAYDLMQTALQQRDVLLREVYHRVKNNLQQIEGLIAMEIATLYDPAARHALIQLSGRVRAMGLVHQLLLQSADLAHISARDFLGKLVEGLARAHDACHAGIRIITDSDDVEMDIERAIAKGLIVNELVVNTIKHAFPDGRRGAILVTYRRMPDGASTIEVCDDGVGFAPGAGEIIGVDHLGLRMVRGLAQQLDGVVETSGPPGASVCVRFASQPQEAG